MTVPKSVEPIETPPAMAASGLVARLRSAVGKGLDDSGVAQLPLRWRFRLVVMAFAVPFLGYIIWAATQQAALEKRHVQAEMRADAMLLAARFDDHIEQVDRLLASAAQSIGTNITDLAAVDTMLQNMRSFVPKSVENIGVWSLDGNSLAALDRRTMLRGVNVADRAYFKQAIATRDFTFQGPMTSRSTSTMILQFARPIFDGKGQLVGVLSMSMRSEGLIGLFDQTGVISEVALVTIVNRDGIVVARSADAGSWVGKSMPGSDELPVFFASRSGVRDAVGADGVADLTGFAVVGKWPWLVTVQEPVDRVLAQTSARLLSNLGAGLFIFVLAFMTAGRVSAWTTRPLMQLAADTNRFGDGDLSHRSSVETGGEIATVAQNFNRMAAALESRERALAASRTQLRAITENIPEQITYVDRDQRYRFVNAHPGPFKNVSPDAMIGKTIREVRGEEAYQAVLPSFLRAMAGEMQTGERSLMVDGRVAHFFVTYIPDFDVNREVVGVYSFAQDITQRKLAELERIESEKRLVTITDNVPALICYVDESRNFRFANRAFEKWFARPLDQIIGQPFDRLMTPELAAKFDYYFLSGMQGEGCEYELEIPTQGSSRWLKCAFIPDIDESGHARGMYGLMHNVTKAKQAEARLTLLAEFDTLTGLANRHQFNETFARVLAENDRDPKPLALMFLDIDHFKQVNDRFGHGNGDQLLKEFAQRLADCVRPTDAVARLAGDEFVVLLEGMHSDEEPQFIARKIIATVEKPFQLDHQTFSVTASIGIAMRGRAQEPASALMKRADEALYEAKRAGRNTFRMAS